MRTIDRSGVAARLRGLLAGQDDGNIESTAQRLGVSELSLRMSVDEVSPHPTIEVLAAVIDYYAVDPTWLLTGKYDSGSHRSAIESVKGRSTHALHEMLARNDMSITGSFPGIHGSKEPQ